MAEIPNITPNSHKYKEEQATNVENTEKKLSPVVSAGKARVKKKSVLSNITKSIISDDAQNVKSYILMDVLIPSFKKALSDIVTNGVDILLYGENGQKKKTNAGRVSYRNYYDDKTGDRYSSRSSSRDDSRASRGKNSDALFDDVVVDSRGEAEEILNRMSEYLDTYPVISVADMYDLANITTFPYTYNDYGWKSVAGAKPVRVNDGYLIKMPPIIPLKNI